MQSYRDLIVWRRSVELALEVYKVTRLFPKEELYGLVSQLRRASVAIPSNIAEGYARRHKKEYVQFLAISYASGAELETQILISYKLNYFSKLHFDNLELMLSEVMKMLYVLKEKINQGN